MIPESSHKLEEEKRNRDYDSMVDKETNDAEKVEPKKLKYISKEMDDEIEQGFSDWGGQICELNLLSIHTT